MKAHPAPQMKYVSSRVRNLPAFGERRLQVEVLVTPQQGVEQQLVDALRLRIGPDAGIEIRGTAFDDHHHLRCVEQSANRKLRPSMRGQEE